MLDEDEELVKYPIYTMKHDLTKEDVKRIENLKKKSEKFVQVGADSQHISLKALSIMSSIHVFSEKKAVFVRGEFLEKYMAAKSKPSGKVDNIKVAKAKRGENIKAIVYLDKNLYLIMLKSSRLIII